MTKEQLNPVVELIAIDEQFKKFGVINKEKQQWIIQLLKHYLGDDPLFFPVIICGLKSIGKDSEKAQPAWRGLPVSVDARDIPGILSAISNSISFYNGKNEGLKIANEMTKINTKKNKKKET
ncbi:MAG: hypothetical protein WC451_05315 [Patescibacteria group bacterium]|jgi:hypothetical protein